MPSIQFHVSRSRSVKEKAREIHEALDFPGGNIDYGIFHTVWRLPTHHPLVAWYLGFMINGADGAHDAMQHVRDDEYYNKIFYGFGGFKQGQGQGQKGDETPEPESAE